MTVKAYFMTFIEVYHVEGSANGIRVVQDMNKL